MKSLVLGLIFATSVAFANVSNNISYTEKVKEEVDTFELLERIGIKEMAEYFAEFVFRLSSGKGEGLSKYSNPKNQIDIKPVIATFKSRGIKVYSVDLIAYKHISTRSAILYYIINSDNGSIGVKIGTYTIPYEAGDKLYIQALTITYDIFNTEREIQNLDMLPAKVAYTKKLDDDSK